jgi:hypothetical protein
MGSSELLVEKYEPITPEELYLLDEYRGRSFTGPTPEEHMAMDEAEILIGDHLSGNKLFGLAQEAARASELARYRKFIWRRAGFARPRNINSCSTELFSETRERLGE